MVWFDYLLDLADATYQRASMMVAEGRWTEARAATVELILICQELSDLSGDRLASSLPASLGDIPGNYAAMQDLAEPLRASRQAIALFRELATRNGNTVVAPSELGFAAGRSGGTPPRGKSSPPRLFWVATLAAIGRLMATGTDRPAVDRFDRFHNKNVSPGQKSVLPAELDEAPNGTTVEQPPAGQSGKATGEYRFIRKHAAISVGAAVFLWALVTGAASVSTHSFAWPLAIIAALALLPLAVLGGIERRA